MAPPTASHPCSALYANTYAAPRIARVEPQTAELASPAHPNATVRPSALSATPLPEPPALPPPPQCPPAAAAVGLGISSPNGVHCAPSHVCTRTAPPSPCPVLGAPTARVEPSALSATELPNQAPPVEPTRAPASGYPASAYFSTVRWRGGGGDGGGGVGVGGDGGDGGEGGDGGGDGGGAGEGGDAGGNGGEGWCTAS